MILLSPGTIDPAALLAGLAQTVDNAGAVVSFTGIVRGDDGVDALRIDHHDRITHAAIEALHAAAFERFALAGLTIVHRVGAVARGEPIVFVAAAAAHRRAAFEAVDFVMDRIKTDVPLWKQEVRGDQARWVEARGQDHADAARWNAA